MVPFHRTTRAVPAVFTRRGRSSRVIAQAVAALVLAALTVPSGVAASEEDELPDGRWRVLPSGVRAQERELTEEQRRDIENLRSIGYLRGSQPAPTLSGVTVHDETRAVGGLNLYTSGHFPGAVLMDMDGNVLHMWERSFLDVWPDRWNEARSENAQYWRYAHLYENGDILAIFEGLGLVKLDRDSHVIWSHAGEEHHDLKVADDGRIYVLTRKAHFRPQISLEDPILEDFVTILDADGQEVRSVSVLEAMGNSRYLPLLEGMSARGDVFHTNAIEILDGSLEGAVPAFRAGSVLLSLRTLSLLVVVDLDTELVTWAAKGTWRKQHDPSVLENGNILLFDNKGNDGRSRVMEIDPATLAVGWVYQGERLNDFFSQMCGAATRLPNGNTLATVSDRGRAIEVTPEGEVVWEFFNPERAGLRNELVATLFEVIRLRPDFPTDWLYGSRQE